MDSVVPFVKIISFVLQLIKFDVIFLTFSYSNVAFSPILYTPLCTLAL